ncbi:isocitrate/isopropylmalate dehydrogenase family protein [Kitasatospora sp. NPDC058184]|uniref:isocitrate/isopropylmalate dehydrogenase family protein n=1 Tax=Kitasatospora sp. NPDC058184 TaxID=3346370 RepID=UPI0036DCF377
MAAISVIPGDGIGPEVVESALGLVDAFGLGLDVDVLDHVGAERYRREGVALGEADLARVAASGAVLLGAIGRPDLEHTGYVREVLLELRYAFDLYANYRPVRLWHDRLSPLRDPARRALDCVIVRENTEGLYSGIGGNLRASSDHEVAVDADVNTRHGVSRILDFAFATARREVCLVDKANAVRAGGRLWQECWRRAAERHPGAATRHLYVDAAAMKLVTEPERFDVIVASNSHGDILSDLAAALAGGIGLAPSASLNPESGFGMFEPVHGSAPDIAGRGVANPFACLLTAALLLRHLGHDTEAAATEAAVAGSIAAGRTTPDLGGTLSTREATRAVLAAL